MSKTYRDILKNQIVKKKYFILRQKYFQKPLVNDTFYRLFSFSATLSPLAAREFVLQFLRQNRYGFFFNPQNRKDFFLQLLNQADPQPAPLMRAEKILQNTFTAFGVEHKYGRKVRWELDFIANHAHSLKRFYSDITLPKNGSDIKVPWEISRFQWAWTLGKAYWMTRRQAFKDKFIELTEDWIHHNPFCHGVNWMTPMEVAIRASNLIAAFYFFCDEEDHLVANSEGHRAVFWVDLLKSLYQHGLYLESNLEFTRRSGNHLIADAVGLLMLGLFFKQTEKGVAWVAEAKEILEHEIIRQTYRDGVDYEMSIAYHRMVTEMLLSAYILADIHQVSFSLRFRDRLLRMLEFILFYTRPNNQAPLIGDSDDGRIFWFNPDQDFNDHSSILSVAAALFERRDFKRSGDQFSEQALWMLGTNGWEIFQRLRARDEAISSQIFRDSQFAVMRTPTMHCIVDCGELGKEGWGGHGHNDTLSFELYANGVTFISDSGTLCYTANPTLRNDMRSVKAHNTVMIDGVELADFAGDFKIAGDHTKPRILQWESNAAEDILVAEHYAYKERLEQGVTHNRMFVFEKKYQRMTVIDRLTGSGTHTAEISFHLCQDAVVRKSSYNRLHILDSFTNQRMDVDYEHDDEELLISPGIIAPRYGVAEQNKVLVFRKKFTDKMTFKIIFSFPAVA